MASEKAKSGADKSGDAGVSEKKKSGGPGIVMLLLFLIVGLGAGGGGAFLVIKMMSPASSASAANGEEGAEANEEALIKKAKKTPHYIPLDPAFVASLEDKDVVRYIQVEIQLMTRDAAVPDSISKFTPRIRNALLMLLSQQNLEDISGREGKEKLQKKALKVVRDVLEDETGDPSIDGLYFTGFVTQ